MGGGREEVGGCKWGGGTYNQDFLVLFLCSLEK